MNNTPDETDRSGQPWSDGDDSILAELYAAGRSLSYMAASLVRSRGAVKHRLSTRSERRARDMSNSVLPMDPIDQYQVHMTRAQLAELVTAIVACNMSTGEALVYSGVFCAECCDP